MGEYYVYILASGRNGTLYVGMANDLVKRVGRHREGDASEFTKQYGVKRLVYYERYNSLEEALVREKQMKK